MSVRKAKTHDRGEGAGKESVPLGVGVEELELSVKFCAPTLIVVGCFSGPTSSTAAAYCVCRVCRVCVRVLFTDKHRVVTTIIM